MYHVISQSDLTEEVCCVVHDWAGVVVDSKCPADITVFGLEQLAVLAAIVGVAVAVLVLHLDLLHVGLGGAADGALHVQHAQQAGALEGKSVIYQNW